MKEVIVTREVLDIYDKYDEDFGLLHERWASKRDRQKVICEQARILSEYVEKLHMSKLDVISVQLREGALKRIDELEKFIDGEVVEILRKRVLDM